MRVPTFALERNQTLYENVVDINLTESGVHPCAMSDVLDEPGILKLAAQPLGYGYTDGSPALRRAIADWHPGARPDNVMVATGASEANLLGLTSVADAGDEVVVIVPNFMQIDGLARGLGIEVKQVALREADGWQPDLDRLAAAIGPRTRLVALCDPNNPTGVPLTHRSREALVEAVCGRGVWLLVDEIYRGAEIDGGPSPTSWGMHERVLVTGGLSKAFGCPGLRIGWMIAPPEIVAEAHRRQDYTTIGTGVLSQKLAEAVLAPGKRDEVLNRGRAILAEGRDVVRRWLAGRNGWSWIEPKAGGMAFLRYDLPVTSEEFVAKLRDEESVFVCAGAWFGLEGHIRVGIGVDAHHLQEGLFRLDRFLRRARA